MQRANETHAGITTVGTSYKACIFVHICFFNYSKLSAFSASRRIVIRVSFSKYHELDSE